MLLDRLGNILVAALLAFLFGEVALGQQNLTKAGEDAPHRGVYEVEFESSEIPANPYLDVQLDVIFTTPNGVEVKVEGFYEGGRVYKARAYAGELGLWRWRSRSNNPGLDRKEGTFRVVPSNLKGKLRVHPSDGRQFAYDNGDWFLHIGDTGYRYLVPSEPNWRAYIDEAAESGITKIRTWFAQSRSTVEALFNSGGKEMALPYWQEMERRIVYALERHPKPIKDFRERWNLACQEAGVPGLLFHDLRRTAVRNLRRAGVAESVIMKITGHRTRGIFDRYNITDQTDTQEAGRIAEEFLAKEHAVNLAQITSQIKGKPN
jgi:hypothetical protein